MRFVVGTIICSRKMYMSNLDSNAPESTLASVRGNSVSKAGLTLPYSQYNMVYRLSKYCISLVDVSAQIVVGSLEVGCQSTREQASPSASARTMR